MVLPPDVPPEVAGFLQEMGYFDADRLTVGSAVPMLTLTPLNGEEAVTVGAPTGTRPTVLIFGSYT